MNTYGQTRTDCLQSVQVNFPEFRWKSVVENAEKWWNGTLGRPYIYLALQKEAPDSHLMSKQPYCCTTAAYGLDVPTDDVIEAWDVELANRIYLADAYPQIFVNFGPGVLAAFLGAQLECRDTVWFHPSQSKPIEELTFEGVDLTQSVWYQRIVDLIDAAHRRWGNSVQLSMTDLGGTLDVLSSFLPGEILLTELYDNPEEVKRLTWEIHEQWWKAYEGLSELMRKVNQGYTAWAQILSKESYYMLQCDFAYMISPEMFDEFVKPELAASCRRLKRAFYHLDGIGQLPHLDSLLTIPELAGVQWIPGDGQPDVEFWPDVYRKIAQADKKIQVFAEGSHKLGYRVLDAIAEQVGCADNIALLGGITTYGTTEWSKDEVMAFLQKYGVDG